MIFTRNFIAVSLINFMVMVAYYLLFVISGPYTEAEFGASPSISGLVAGLMLIGCLAGRFVTGRIISQIGFKIVLFAGILIYTVSMGLYLVADNLPLLMLIRFLSGIGVGCIGTVTGTLIVHIIPIHLYGQGINYFSMSTVLALALGPFLGILLMQHIGFTELFLLCAVFGVAGFFLGLLLSFPVLEPPSTEPTPSRGFRLRNYIAFEIIPLSAVVLIVSACYGSVQAFISFYTREIGLAPAASFFFLVYAVAAFCLRPFAGKLFDRKGPDIIIYPALIAAACGLALLSQTDSAATLLISGALLGIGIGNFQTTAQAASIKLVPKKHFGQATSTYFIFLDMGIGIGPYLLGLLVPVTGYDGLYLFTVGLVLISIPLYYLVYSRRKAAPEVDRLPGTRDA